jgi:predicted protein tyrosine phosphatase
MVDVDRITDQIWLGSLQAAENADWLGQEKITHIISLLSEQTHRNIDPHHKCLEKFGVNIHDTPSSKMYDYFDTYSNIVKRILTNPKAQILIHCHAGISRSPTLLIAILAKLRGLPVVVGWDFVKRVRCCIKPNEGFKDQLLRWNDELTRRYQLKRRKQIRSQVCGMTRFYIYPFVCNFVLDLILEYLN